MAIQRSLFLAALLCGACDDASEVDPVVTPTPIDPATAGTIQGKVLYRGTPPPNPKLPVGGNSECSALHSATPYDEVVLVKDGGPQNVFLHVKEGLEGKIFDWPKTPATMANQKCVYVPRVIGAQVRQPIRFTNEDPTDHNIHGFFTRGGDFNFSLRGRGSHDDRKVRQQEVMLRVKCDLHPWMVGYVGVVPHPFFAVSGPEGGFELKGLPPGDYTLEAWHEMYGAQSRKVKLDPKGAAKVEFSYPP